MMVGLIQGRGVSLTAWAPYVHSRAVSAQSLVRRFERWWQNQRIEVHQVYGPFIQQALAEWGRQALSGARPLHLVGAVLSGAHLPRLSGTRRADCVEGAPTSA